MKVLVLGGAGQEGRTAVERLAAHSEVTQVIVADLNIDKAQALARTHGEKVSAIHVDIRDETALDETLRQADVVINLVGPYFLYQEHVLKAAIHAGVNYVDISDDWQPTLACLELSDKANAAGITAIIGLGVSPGSMNMLAMYAAQQLDSVDEVHLRWAVSVTDVDELGASAAVHHALHMVDGAFPTFKNGEITNIQPFTEPEIFEFPKLGPQPVFHVGHPEPATLPKYLPGVQTVSQKGSVPGFNEEWQGLHEFGLTSSDPLTIAGNQVSPQQVAMALMSRLDDGSTEGLPEPLSEFHTIVVGSSNGKHVELEYSFRTPDQMSPNTGTP
ncbi:MAG: NmrA family NAD(P)-binding protein, partial [Leucobacter sp.]|nr:NmrA family NAD(P)-binding protein [Leucobacter sp.]